MKKTIATAGVAAAGLILLASSNASAHPYTTWKEDGMSSDAHTHVNTGEYDFTTETAAGAAVVSGSVGGGYFTTDGVFVTASGYYLQDGTFVEGRYEAGSVFAGGAVSGNTIVTGGGIVEVYGYDESRTTTTTTTTTTTSSGASAQLTAQQAKGGKKILADGTPYYCWCAQSADGEKVPVYATTGNARTVPIYKIGGGLATFDVESYYNGSWRVSWRLPDGNVKYGWVKEDAVICKRTLTR